MKKGYRQGDVFITETKSLETEIKSTHFYNGWKKRENPVVREGEVTGHAHKMVGDFELFEQWGQELTAIVGPKGANMVHEEHGTLELKPGTYFIGFQREYDEAEKIRRVMD